MYSKYLSEKLTERMAALSDRDVLDLTEELTLVRVAALQAVQLFDLTQNIPDDAPRVGETRMAAGLVMREALEAAGEMAERASRIEKNRDDKVTVESLHVVVNQIVDRAYEAFGESVPPEKVREFADACREIRLPTQDVKGTSITPDQDAREMNDTIPMPMPTPTLSR